MPGEPLIDPKAEAAKLPLSSRGLNAFYNRLKIPSSLPNSFSLLHKYKFEAGLELIKPTNSRLRNWGRFVGDTISLNIREITVPDVATKDDAESIETHSGFLSLTSMSKALTTTNEITIEFLNSTQAIHEDFFYYWIRETLSPDWSYDEFPFTKGKLFVRILDHSGRMGENAERVEYQFFDIFPTGFATIDPSHEPGDQFSRPVNFKFNYMSIQDQNQAEVNFLEPE
jgi:hypothetical protein